MSLSITDILSIGVDKIVTATTDGIDKLFTSDEEKLIIKAKMMEEANAFKTTMETQLNVYEQEVTKRWQSDNEHIITRLTRPISFAWVIVLFSVIVIGDTNFGFSVKDAYIPVLETLLVTMTVAYFGSRGMEKGIKHFKGSNNGNG